MAQTVAEIFEMMPERVNKEKTQGMQATYQFNITGDGGGEWYVVIDNGDVAVNPGTAESPSITITCTSEDWVKIVNGELNGQQAFLMGKLKIQGDMTLAMKLQSVFSLGG